MHRFSGRRTNRKKLFCPFEQSPRFPCRFKQARKLSATHCECLGTQRNVILNLRSYCVLRETAQSFNGAAERGVYLLRI